MIGLENYVIGDTVLAYWQPSDAYFVGTVVEQVDTGFVILFEDGDEAAVPTAKIRRYDLNVGSAVIARWNDGEFHNGRIAKVVGRACFIHYDDGDERWVPLSWIAVQ